MSAWLTLLPFLQERYGIAAEHIYAHTGSTSKTPLLRRLRAGTGRAQLGYVPGSAARLATRADHLSPHRLAACFSAKISAASIFSTEHCLGPYFAR